MAAENLSPDIYAVNDYVNNVKKEFITGVNEDTLMLGIFGYTGQIFSDMFQNTIVMASEFSNESIPTKAKFEKNIIAHALGYGVIDINAVPAQMEVVLAFLEDDIINWANAKTMNNEEQPWTFIFDKNNKIYFGDFEFHTDYDIVIKKVEVKTQGATKRFAYTAQYSQEDIDIGNPVSDVTNPYLTPPVRVNIEGSNVILTKCIIRQVEKTIQNTKVLSDNDVSAKTITFTFDGQLAAFSLDVTEGTETYHMVPVYEGLNVDTGGKLYFWYTYLDTNTIRIKFDRNSKIPAVNASVMINLQTTQGSKGNFTYYAENNNDYPVFVFESERLNYANINCQVRPVTGSSLYGTDKKSIEDLKELIPKEALSRGSITNLKDLENYFNMLDSEYSKLYFYKKRDNCLERLYYSFMIMRNDYNIVPTNTIDVVVDPGVLHTEENSGKLVLRQGQVLILSGDGTEARLLKPDEVLPDEDGSLYDGRFAYYLPYDFVINQSPLYGMYFLTTIHAEKILDFHYINEKCLYQYIATSIKWNRNCLEDHNTYVMDITLGQNITTESKDIDAPIYIDENGNTVCNVDVYMIIYDKDKNPHRWAKAEMVGFENGQATDISYQFKFTTEDYIDNQNRIRIETGLYDIGSNNESYAHLDANMMTRIFVVSKQGNSTDLGEPALSKYIPGLDGMTLSNTYNIIGGLDFFYDYSSIVKSTVIATEDEVTEGGDTIYPSEPEVKPSDPSVCDCEEDIEEIQSNLTWKTSIEDTSEDENFVDKNANMIDDEHEVSVGTALRYHVIGMPVVKYGYFRDEEVVKSFFRELVDRKVYIDDAVEKLEDAFEMDFKFFNTYGPSRFFTWDNALEVIDRVNISLFFKLKLKPNYDTNIKEEIKQDIKNYIENINEIRSLHIPNLVTEITNKYNQSIVFFEFVSINGYDPSYQHIYAMDVPDGIMVPEFININTLPDTTPDINIELV